jgi:uncharacterized protein YndB with AHSA1/START domain/dihydrofolate reductase
MSRNPTTLTADPGTPFIDVVREFEATPAQVFRASTDPELVTRWLGPRDIGMRVIEYDARTGGSYRYVHTDADGGEHRFRGVFHSVVPAERIIQTFEYEGWPDSVSVDTATYEDLGGRTRLHTHSVFPSVEARDTALESGMERGIVDSMDRLEELVTGAPTPAAGRVVVDISMSLDGYVTAAGVDLDHGLGVGGEVLHDWAFGRRTPRDEEILARTYDRTGAVIMGRRLFDFVDGPTGWDESMGYGAEHERDQPVKPPVFVVTHEAPATTRLGDRFRFVTDGLEATLDQARAAAGDRDVVIMGGGEVACAFLRAGLVDVLSIHLVPVVLGAGTPLFPGESDVRLRLDLIASESTDAAEHLTYRVSHPA